ncbi:hypothetical protein GCM10010384_54670 [Streptomyces djakartensis]|uniref:Uncharacterized protein n=1 Tax=Streptomyces djakartensis TaxID=68193 RepID=A0ABQ3A897_9ACTN|nr:hypothetical protein GCM10010384_54670 [Streptomyces djakartensis]
MDAFLPCAVRVAAGEVGEDAAGLGEADVGALADGEVAEGLGDVGLADADGAEEDDRFAGVEPAQGSQVADLGGGQFRGGGVMSNSSRVTCCSNPARCKRRWNATVSRRVISS